MAVDLHIHSNASDGTVPPDKIPALAAAAGLSAIALTDHDTIGGIADFMACQQTYTDLELIPGVELSSRFEAKELHIVGLYIDPDSTALADFTRRMRLERIRRAEMLMQKLFTLGYQITWEDLREAGMPDGVPGRPHFAQVLIKKYNFPDTATVFEHLLKRGRSGYVPRNLPAPEEAISAIKAAGGLAIWAHPLNCAPRGNFIVRTLRRLKKAGLDGLEAYYSMYTPAKTERALQLAAELDLAVSGGSDFHGSIHPNINIGTGGGSLHVPDTIMAALHRAKEPKVIIMN